MVRILDLTTNGGIRATCNLVEEGKKGIVVGRGRPTKKCMNRVVGILEVIVYLNSILFKNVANIVSWE